ncbi:MAG: hypothetical protein ACXVHO_02050 [Methanobacterium sp.]
MLRFEGIKEFNGDENNLSECAIIFSDDELPKKAYKSIEDSLNRYFSSQKDENITIQVKYQDNVAEIIELIKCNRENLIGKTDEQILRGLKKQRGIFEDYYNDIKPY